MKKFKNLTVGGTFDHFHLGHEALLTKAFSLGNMVWLGITSQKYFSNLPPVTAKNLGIIEVYEKRLATIQNFLSRNNYNNRVTIVPIDDRFGTTLIDEKLEAIVVSPETELIATEINLLRAQKDFSALDIIRVEWVLARDGNPIHSTRIRNGEIDREGYVFELSSDWGVRKLPSRLREQLKQPLGQLISEFEVRSSKFEIGEVERNIEFSSREFTMNYELRTKSYLVSVGDYVTSELLKNGITPDISIVDLQIQRKKVYENVEEIGFRSTQVLKKAINQAGTINYEAYKKLFELMRLASKPSILQIEGEEDLLTLLALFLAPLGSLIVYGQPSYAEASDGKLSESDGRANNGMVIVEVTEAKKHEIRKYLEEFEKIISD